jgi:hypothetical protein
LVQKGQAIGDAFQLDGVSGRERKCGLNSLA